MKTFGIPNGALTAIITPFTQDGEINWVGLQKLFDFQVSQEISGVITAGTTAESATLNEPQHDSINHEAIVRGNTFILAGCGSNSTKEAMHYVERVERVGGEAVLLVDPYYNGPSSLEIRREYYAPIAKAFPNIAIVPYIIPGRTGCALLPEDLTVLNAEFPNICAVKEATGDLSRMKRTRSLLGRNFQIFSGDDDKTFQMMLDGSINACGVISVISNIAPAAVQKMCQAMLLGDLSTAEAIKLKLQPLFEIVTVFSDRLMNIGNGTIVTDKFRNPLPIKTAMNILGMPAGPCRQPLGKMSPEGIGNVWTALSIVWKHNPEVLKPIEDFFGVNIAERLANNAILADLSY